MRNEYLQGRWEDKNVSFIEFIRLVVEVNRIREEKDRADDKEKGFLITLAEDIFGMNEYSREFYESGEFVKSLQVMDLALRAGQGGGNPPDEIFKKFGNKYKSSLTAIWAVASGINQRLNDDRNKEKYKNEYQQVMNARFFALNKSEHIKASQARYESLVLQYKVQEQLGFADKYIPKPLLRISKLALQLFYVIDVGDNDNFWECRRYFGDNVCD